MKDSEALEIAANLLDVFGWNRGDYQNPKTKSLCMIGAINTAICGKPDPGDVESDLEDPVMNFLYRDIFGSNWTFVEQRDHAIVHWNDHVARDKRSVQRKMRKCATHLKKQGK